MNFETVMAYLGTPSFIINAIIIIVVLCLAIIYQRKRTKLVQKDLDNLNTQTFEAELKEKVPVLRAGNLGKVQLETRLETRNANIHTIVNNLTERMKECEDKSDQTSASVNKIDLSVLRKDITEANNQLKKQQTSLDDVNKSLTETQSNIQAIDTANKESSIDTDKSIQEIITKINDDIKSQMDNINSTLLNTLTDSSGILNDRINKLVEDSNNVLSSIVNRLKVLETRQQKKAIIEQQEQEMLLA